MSSTPFQFRHLFWMGMFLLFTGILFNCSHSRKALGTRTDDGKIRINFVQLNDIYEISPLDEGRSGGIARVAGLRRALTRENPLTYTLLAGDFLSPSAMGTIPMENGQRINGLQMVAALNTAGIDLVTFGNHEFDLNEATLLDRINVSRFDWVSANVSHRNVPFEKIVEGQRQPIPATIVRNFTDADGTTARVGIFGLSINSTTRDYVQYDNYLDAARRALQQLEGKCDFIVALTHLPFRDDSILAVRFPSIKLIVGGHEHVNSYTKVGPVIIAKADANVKTVYVHAIEFDRKERNVTIQSRLVRIDESLPEDPVTRDTVNAWNQRAYNLLSRQFDPCEVIATLPGPLDGTELSVRSRETNLTKLIAEAISAAPGQPTDCAIFNSGAVRIDDTLWGNVTNYDLFRVLPFPGKIFIVGMRGSLIKTILAISDTSHGNGCFLQHVGLRRTVSGWLIRHKPLSEDTIYQVAVNDFLVSGFQERMTFLKDSIGNRVDSLTGLPGAGMPASNDWQRAVGNYLRRLYPPKPSAKKSTSLPCF
jgi:2',3'-cyclic-nucleotide 2'-phosphodiesterase (5'-nucleotidase family)